MKQTDRSRGFTLIELLIVVVIIALVAALIMPRFLSQSKRAEVTEVLQMIGAMQRAANNFHDLGGESIVLDEKSSSAQWENIGMRDPNISPNRRFEFPAQARG